MYNKSTSKNTDVRNICSIFAQKNNIYAYENKN